MKLRIPGMAVLLASLLVPLSAAAFPALAPPPDPLHRVGAMADRLGLTGEQESQVLEVMNAAKVDSAVDRERSHQIRAQLERLVPVHKVIDLTEEGPHVERELALVKVAGKGELRVEALRLAELFRANVVDTTTSSFVFELTGSPDKVASFIALMRELGLVEVGRSGIVGMMRGADKI